MSKICSELYSDFFYKINGMTFSMDEFVSFVSSAITEVAQELKIGRSSETFMAPKTPFNIDGINQTVILYTSEAGYDDCPETFIFRTGENGTLSMSFYPEKGCKWNEEDLKDIRFIAENLFILGGRVQMLGVMNKISSIDITTGALNMHGFVMHCEKLVNSGDFKDYAVIFVNLKNFRYVNRLIGEKQADIVLKCCAHRLMKFVKDDGVVSRPGGDNFCTVIRKERVNELLEFVSDMQFENELAGEKRSINISSRTGIYMTVENDTANNAINSASTALGIAKNNSRTDNVYFRADMMDKTFKANEISTIFPEALRKEEFVVFYQPKVGLADNSLCGCEALTRWIRNGCIVPPVEFIPVLEHEGSICRLDFYVFDRVCADIKRWINMGIVPVRVSTNFSKLHLHDVDFADKIIEIINKHGVDPSYVEVELTESSGYEDYEALAEFVRKMKKFGVSTSIDDFGTGYSSLNLLKDLDVDIIKLDKSFLDNLGDKKKSDEVVIRNIVNMVNELDMKVVAEGVETNIQADLLEDFQCSMAQGYLFDKPLPCSEFEERLKTGRVYKGVR